MQSYQTLVEELLNIEFICIDNNLEEEKVFNKFSYEDVLSFLNGRNSELSFISLKTGESFKEFEVKKDYESFHIYGHWLMVDKIINYILFDKYCNLSQLVASTLQCSQGTEELALRVLKIPEQRAKSHYESVMKHLRQQVKYENKMNAR